jgi:uncharacterized protein
MRDEEIDAVFSSEDAPDNAPIKSAYRIASLDFIRGLAVMGILAANIVAFGQPRLAYIYPDAFLVPNGDPDGWMWIAQFVLIDGKMRTLFTLLFGAGLYLFMERAWARGATRWLQARRLGWLALFGLIHFYFIWRGDILFLYAISGLVALLCVGLAPKAKIALGGALYALGAITMTGLFASMMMFAQIDPGDDAELAKSQAEMGSVKTDMVKDAAKETQFKQSGDYAGFVENGLSPQGQLYDPLINLFFLGLETFPLILIGMALYQTGFFSGQYDRAKMIRWGWIGLIAGALGSLAIGLWNQSQGFGFWDTNVSFSGLSAFPRLPMALGMAALLVVYTPQAGGWLSERITAAGRAAFTNYLGTSIVMLFVFHGWALGLFGALNRPQLYLVTLAAWAVMLVWSKPWLERFRYGPLEWLWRCLTYGKMFPLKR